MVSREQIIEELKRIAEIKVTKTLTEEDFEKYSTISLSTLRFHLGSWQRALNEAGLGDMEPAETISKTEPIDDDELLSELIQLYEETGEMPTLAVIRAKGRFGDHCYIERWKSISVAFQIARQKFPRIIKPTSPTSIPPMDLMPPVEKTREEEILQLPEFHAADKAVESQGETDMNHESEGLSPQKIKFIPSTIKPPIEKAKPRLSLEPVNFRGLRYAPASKVGVLYLFGMIGQELGFLIESFVGEFPDCEGKRCVDPGKNLWEPVRIQLEYKSTDFKTRISSKNYDESLCDLLVCWIHDWAECPIEVLELRSTLQHLT